MTQTKNSTKKQYQQLQPEERGIIQILHDQCNSIRQIAYRLHRSPSTVSREIRRGTVKQRNSDYLFFTDYYAETGQIMYKNNRTHCHSKGLLKPCWLFFKMLEQALKQHPRVDSVDGFIHRFKGLHPECRYPSVPTVYRYIDQGLLNLKNSDLPQKLRRHIKGNHNHQRHNKKILGTSIEQRPSVVDDRTTFGNWEGELVKGKRIASEPALLTITERKSRLELIIKIPNYHADTCLDALQKVINQHNSKWFKSITFDNGSEFSLLSKVHGTQIYFAHPYSPWERGSNENANGLIREYIPKGLSLKQFSEDQITRIQNAINAKLRKSLKYLSSKTCFNQYTTC